MTETNRFEKKTVLYSAALALALALNANPIWAEQSEQSDSNEGDQTSEEAATDEESADLGKIVVTGSRLQRETYTSIQPLQIITNEGSREAGLVEAADILQQSTAAAGQQIDLTFSGFVLDNGPGASTLSLRGLGSARTLLLVNGRRLAPSGVEGAPTAPDLNLLPSSMVQRYEVLLDGASSVYGSDAVAGVTNIIMRKDYDGFEGDVYYTTRDQGSGDTVTLNAAWGKNFDRGFFGVGVEYFDAQSQRLRDSKWTDQCEEHREIDQNGKIRSQDLYHPEVLGMPWDSCVRGALAGRVFTTTPSGNPYYSGPGSIYYTPGFSNGGWGNFSESAFFVNVDSDGDGITDVNYKDYDLNGGDAIQNAMLYPEQERWSAMSYGEYTFENAHNATGYFELNYNRRKVHQEGGGYQLFPVVPATNPYNLCNPDAINGVDCGVAFTELLLENEGYRNTFFNTYGAYPEQFGFGPGPVGPGLTQPIVSVRDDRVNYDTKMEQWRYVVGLKGDLPFIDFGPMNSWQYDLAYSNTKSDGTASRWGVREDRLNYSLATSRFAADGSVICGTGSDGCVPINMFAPSLYPLGAVVGDFATQAERDYLFGSRDFRTVYKQSLFTAFADGYLFDLPGGSAMAGIGFEYRVDEIDSIPNPIARDGSLFGYFSDEGAVGEKSTTEFFGEIELPIVADKPFADSLVLNLSARWTKDELYGSDTTGSAKLGWRPIPSLLLRGTWGTSFRAPNLREVFLIGQSGFNNGYFDPCVVPEDARGSLEGGAGYDPSADDREEQVLANCVLAGVDPTSLGIADNRQSIYSVEVFTEGRTDLLAENSQSYTYGFAFDQPWFDTFDLTFGATYWNINIDDTIIEPSSQFLTNECYNDVQLDSAFCELINRDEDGYVEFVDAKFLNRDNQKVSGVDINMNYDQTFNIGSHAIDFGADLVMTHTEEASETYLSDEGEPDYDDDAGEWGYPDWKGQLGLRANISDFRITWVVNYIGKVDQDPAGIDPMDDIYGIADTCLGPPDDVLCRDVGFGDAYWLHSASVYYYGDTWTLGAGIRNVFDESPPLVDGTEVLSVNNVPIGYGYDLRGRTFFVNLAWRP